MKCDCCGRKKRLFESFAEVAADGVSLHLCAECNDLLYKLRDAASEDDEKMFEEIEALISQRNKGCSPEYEVWAKHFIKMQRSRLKKASDSPADKDDVSLDGDAS